MAELLVVYKAVRNPVRTLCRKMGSYDLNDSCHSNGRRVQFWYAELSHKTMISFCSWIVNHAVVSDLSVLPTAAFNFAMAVGLYVVRWRRKRANLPRPQFRAWDPVVIFNILVQVYLLVMPWYPPAGGQYAGDVSFWYATYVVTGIGMYVYTTLLIISRSVS